MSAPTIVPSSGVPSSGAPVAPPLPILGSLSLPSSYSANLSSNSLLSGTFDDVIRMNWGRLLRTCCTMEEASDNGGTYLNICRDGYMQGWVYAGMGAERGGGAATARHVRDAEVIQYVQATPCSRTIIYTRR